MMKHVQDPLVPLKERNPRIPEAVCRVIDKMMAKAPWDRHQSYDELIDELSRILTGRSDITESCRKT